MKIAIIGVGNIGECLTKSLLNKVKKQNADWNIDEIIWLGRNANKMNAKKSDLIHRTLHKAKYEGPEYKTLADYIDKKLKVTTDYSHISDADFIITSYGTPRPIGMTNRIAVLKDNNMITENTVNQIRPYLNEKTVIINLTNPVDVITWQLRKLSGLPENQVLGVAGMVDVTRFADAIHHVICERDPSFTYQDIDMQSLIVLGEHGTWMVPLLSQAIVRGKPLLSQLISEEEKQAIIDYTKNKGPEIANANDGTCAHHTPAAAVISAIDIIGNKKSGQIFASIHNPEFKATMGSVVNINNGKMSVKVLDNLTAKEQQELTQAAKEIKELRQKLKAGSFFTNAQNASNTDNVSVLQDEQSFSPERATPSC